MEAASRGTAAVSSRHAAGRLWWYRALAPLLLAALIASMATVAGARIAAAAQGCTAGGEVVAVPGGCAPDFTMSDIHGHTVHLMALRGHPVLLNFWGVGCIYCRHEFPALKTFAAAFMSRGGVVIGINTWHESTALIAGYERKNQVNWPLVPDPRDQVSSIYAVHGTPTNVFIDRHGVTKVKAFGPLTLSQLQHDAQGL